MSVADLKKGFMRDKKAPLFFFVRMTNHSLFFGKTAVFYHCEGELAHPCHFIRVFLHAPSKWCINAFVQE
jgi:hypothetical protein